MFVERMKVLEYRQKFEVELTTFPSSTNTGTPTKLILYSSFKEREGEERVQNILADTDSLIWCPSLCIQECVGVLTIYFIRRYGWMRQHKFFSHWVQVSGCYWPMRLITSTTTMCTSKLRSASGNYRHCSRK